jgi:PAS domain-containing protein
MNEASEKTMFQRRYANSAALRLVGYDKPELQRRIYDAVGAEVVKRVKHWAVERQMWQTI